MTRIDSIIEAKDHKIITSTRTYFDDLMSDVSCSCGYSHGGFNDVATAEDAAQLHIDRERIRQEMMQEMFDYIDGDAENGPRYGVEQPDDAEFEAEIDLRLEQEREMS